ncbi:MAG TPA: low molecular weight protein-tyrosine-phosphatase [Kofleriaceae bacterium]|jgi:protein-tyrosine phosphatase
MIRVCFVCLGNICRSPTAEGVMQKLVEDAGLAHAIELDSAGTGNWHAGELADARTRAAAARRGYALTHRARQFTASDVARFDLILAMDRSNLESLRRIGADAKLLRSFDPAAAPNAEVPDPYDGGPQGFEHVLDLCESACAGLLAHLRTRLA